MKSNLEMFLGLSFYMYSEKATMSHSAKYPPSRLQVFLYSFMVRYILFLGSFWKNEFCFVFLKSWMLLPPNRPSPKPPYLSVLMNLREWLSVSESWTNHGFGAGGWCFSPNILTMCKNHIYNILAFQASVSKNYDVIKVSLLNQRKKFPFRSKLWIDRNA